MTYSTLVYLQIGQPNGAVPLAATDLAEGWFGAGVIGVAAYRPMQLAYSESYIATDAFGDSSHVIEWLFAVTLAPFYAWVTSQKACECPSKTPSLGASDGVSLGILRAPSPPLNTIRGGRRGNESKACANIRRDLATPLDNCPALPKGQAMDRPSRPFVVVCNTTHTL